jgi:hypothetical protein
MTTLAYISEIDKKVQKWLDLLGRSSLLVQLLEPEYHLRLMKIGDAVRMEQGDLSEMSAREFALTTELKVDPMIAVAELPEWLIQQIKLSRQSMN